MENFIWVRFENYNPGRASQKAWELFCPLEIKAQGFKF